MCMSVERFTKLNIVNIIVNSQHAQHLQNMPIKGTAVSFNLQNCVHANTMHLKYIDSLKCIENLTHKSVYLSVIGQAYPSHLSLF